MKAFLHGLGRGPWGHDLVRMLEMTIDAGIQPPPEVADALRRLSRHDIPARYPDAHPSGPPGIHYAEADAAEALADARAVLGFVDRTWDDLRG